MDLKKFTHCKGLPGGPNENAYSVEGYKADSPDRFNPFNVINSGNITMDNVPHPVLGIDNKGNAQVMTPGNDYQFPGDQVFELPIAQSGKNIQFGYQPLRYDSVLGPVSSASVEHNRPFPALANRSDLNYKARTSLFNEYGGDGFGANAGLKIQGKGYQKSQPGDPYFDLAAGWNTTQGVNAQLKGGYDFNFGNRTDAFTAGPWGGASFQTKMPEGIVSPNASGYAPETRAMLQYGLRGDYTHTFPSGLKFKADAGVYASPTLGKYQSAENLGDENIHFAPDWYVGAGLQIPLNKATRLAGNFIDRFQNDNSEASINDPLYTPKLQDGGPLAGEPPVTTPPAPVDPYQATMDWLNSNPYMHNNKPIYLDELEMVKSNNYPSMHGKMISIPGAGNYGEDQYQLATMPAGYQGLPVYLVNGKPVVVDKKFNQEYFNMYQQNKLIGKDELFPIYGRGIPYQRPATNMQDGGYVDMDLTDEEIQGLRHQGYWIEEL